MKVTAQASRSGGWWAVSVPEVDGLFTQSKRLDQVAAMVADAVELLLGTPADQVEVVVVPEIADSVRQHMDQAEKLRTAASVANHRAAIEVRSAARQLQAQGLTVRDVGAVLGVSYQRAHQLVSERVDAAVLAVARRGPEPIGAAPHL